MNFPSLMVNQVSAMVQAKTHAAQNGDTVDQGMLTVLALPVLTTEQKTRKRQTGRAPGEKIEDADPSFRFRMALVQQSATPTVINSAVASGATVVGMESTVDAQNA